MYALFVAGNEGEFWPFSIYPMFSRGGIPWSRAVVREVPDDSVRWEPVTLHELPGEPYALAEHGIDHIDLANFVSKTEVWDDRRVTGLRKMFGSAELERSRLLVMRATGRIIEGDSVALSFVPYALLAAEKTTLNQELRRTPTR